MGALALISLSLLPRVPVARLGHISTVALPQIPHTISTPPPPPPPPPLQPLDCFKGGSMMSTYSRQLCSPCWHRSRPVNTPLPPPLPPFRIPLHGTRSSQPRPQRPLPRPLLTLPESLWTNNYPYFKGTSTLQGKSNSSLFTAVVFICTC